VGEEAASVNILAAEEFVKELWHIIQKLSYSPK
jgi:hypothetical protein